VAGFFHDDYISSQGAFRLSFLETVNAPAVVLPVKAPFLGQFAGTPEALLLLKIPAHEFITGNFSAYAGDQIPGLVRTHCKSGGESIASGIHPKSISFLQPHFEADWAAFSTLRLILQQNDDFVPFLGEVISFRQRESHLLSYSLGVGQAAPVFFLRVDVRIKEESMDLVPLLLESFDRSRCAHRTADM
jgi:hypothetical protein